MNEYRVITTFCNGVVQDHWPTESLDAFEEFTEKMAEAKAHPKPIHVRTVELQVLGKDEVLVRKFESGPHPCAHRP